MVYQKTKFARKLNFDVWYWKFCVPNFNFGKQNLYFGKWNLDFGKENLNFGKRILDFGKQNLNFGKPNLCIRLPKLTSLPNLCFCLPNLIWDTNIRFGKAEVRGLWNFFPPTRLIEPKLFSISDLSNEIA